MMTCLGKKKERTLGPSEDLLKEYGGHHHHSDAWLKIEMAIQKLISGLKVVDIVLFLRIFNFTSIHVGLVYI